jgi:hypothetical protein
VSIGSQSRSEAPPLSLGVTSQRPASVKSEHVVECGSGVNRSSGSRAVEFRMGSVEVADNTFSIGELGEGT